MVSDRVPCINTWIGGGGEADERRGRLFKVCANPPRHSCRFFMHVQHEGGSRPAHTCICEQETKLIAHVESFTVLRRCSIRDEDGIGRGPGWLRRVEKLRMLGGVVCRLSSLVVTTIIVYRFDRFFYEIFLLDVAGP